MYEFLKGKKLLVIGSDSGNVNIINAAREMGIYTIAADGIKDWSKAPAKRAADEGWDIDYSQTEAMVQKCLEAGVDGVFAGYSEFRVLAACRIAGALGKPFYATEEQINLTRNKRTFKDVCQQYDIPVPKDYCFHYPLSSQEKAGIEYPVIVKPADYAGRKGITVCRCAEELDAAVEYAASKSQSKTIIVEDYLDGLEFSSIYTLSDGAISLSSVNEKYITRDQEKISGLCEFLISPARSYDRYIEELDGKLRKFIRGIQARNGVIFFQGMITGKKLYVFEMGYRINGNNDFLVIDRFNGLNFMKMCIAHSLCGSMTDDISKDNPLYPGYACSLLMYAHGGTVGKLSLGQIPSRQGIRDVTPTAWVGKEIPEDGSTAQCVVKMKLYGDSLEEIAQLAEFAQRNVVVEDVNGKNMLFKPFDTGCLLR